MGAEGPADHARPRRRGSRHLDRRLVSAAASPLQRSVVISHFGEKLGIPPNQLEASLKKEKKGTVGGQPELVMNEKVQRQKFEPLSHEDKRILKIMVMNPADFTLLEEAGVRECLEGGMGEIIFLQMKMMLQERADVQPEEVMSAFADGPERSLVAEMLLNTSQLESIQEEDGEKSTEFAALLELLKLKKMRIYSSQLDAKIKEALENDDLSALADLLKEKEGVKEKMRRLRV